MGIKIISTWQGPHAGYVVGEEDPCTGRMAWSAPIYLKDHSDKMEWFAVFNIAEQELLRTLFPSPAGKEVRECVKKFIDHGDY